MDATTKMTIEIYEKYLTDLRKLQSEGHGSAFVDDGDLTVDDDILRVETHIRRLATDHAECVEACCLSCPMAQRRVHDA